MSSVLFVLVGHAQNTKTITEDLDFFVMQTATSYLLMVSNSGDRDICVDEIGFLRNTFPELYDGEGFTPYRGTMGHFLEPKRVFRLRPGDIVGQSIPKRLLLDLCFVDSGDKFGFAWGFSSMGEGFEQNCKDALFIESLEIKHTAPIEFPDSATIGLAPDWCREDETMRESAAPTANKPG